MSTAVMKGRFIVIEGIDGCGKDTLAQSLSNHLLAMGRSAHITCEPTNGPWGKLIREKLGHVKDDMEGEDFHLGLQRMFVFDRVSHLVEDIHPALLAGQDVICVRFWLSTLAYGQLGTTLDQLIALHEEHLLGQGLIPDMTMLLDLPPEVGLYRIGISRAHRELFERQEMLSQVRANYLSLITRDDVGPICVLDATVSPQAVLSAALDALGQP